MLMKIIDHNDLEFIQLVKIFKRPSPMAFEKSKRNQFYQYLISMQELISSSICKLQRLSGILQSQMCFKKF